MLPYRYTRSVIAAGYLGLVALSSFSCTLSAGRTGDRESWAMVAVADLPFALFSVVPCGDADHDGLREFCAFARDDSGWPHAVEYVDSGHFSSARIGRRLSIHTLGDLDRDGFGDVVASGDFAGFKVLESPDSFSVPTVPVWQTPDTIGCAYSFTTADIDVDSAREFLVDYASKHLVIYECVGNNRFERKQLIRPGGVPTQTPDMDRDGVPELVVGRDGGCVAFYEAAGDDSVVFRDTVRISAAADHSYFFAMTGARDMDRDGRHELIAPCWDRDHAVLRLAVLESPANDSFVVVWAEERPGGWLCSVSSGDIDGDSTPEFMFASGSIMLYRSIGDNQYACFWQTDSGSKNAALYDIDADGKDELIYDRPAWHTIIRKWLPVGVEEWTKAALERLAVLPSVARRSEVVRVAGLPQSAQCDVVDASGRIVAALASGVWRPASSTAGTYFLRIRLDNQAVVRKVLVVE